ncbi:unnamed protein product [Boreogadus saida]
MALLHGVILVTPKRLGFAFQDNTRGPRQRATVWLGVLGAGPPPPPCGAAGVWRAARAPPWRLRPVSLPVRLAPWAAALIVVGIIALAPGPYQFKQALPACPEARRSVGTHAAFTSVHLSLSLKLGELLSTTPPPPLRNQPGGNVRAALPGNVTPVPSDTLPHSPEAGQDLLRPDPLPHPPPPHEFQARIVRTLLLIHLQLFQVRGSPPPHHHPPCALCPRSAAADFTLD